MTDITHPTLEGLAFPEAPKPKQHPTKGRKLRKVTLADVLNVTDWVPEDNDALEAWVQASHNDSDSSSRTEIESDRFNQYPGWRRYTLGVGLVSTVVISAKRHSNGGYQFRDFYAS